MGRSEKENVNYLRSLSDGELHIIKDDPLELGFIRSNAAHILRERHPFGPEDSVDRAERQLGVE